MLHVKLLPRLSISSTKYYDVITPTNVFNRREMSLILLPSRVVLFLEILKCKILKFLLNYEISNKSCLIICHFNTCS